ncbi:PQQ-binding-like beta-propeller repeat protein [Actinoplanes sp. NEAU-A12]|uniref:PQQ-binding-like beta-propeller repeat protein n=1 Tax=Actinoplanes sandaracinus TaxID=3045177 RepID=A0ABT6WU54_9ACTN|nr:PQQ-binding-like beta-propeller repeat protein [Actinoplanes sandaracinus]MDI6103269.1 PQQ-binding-like beta-propeller repeat protein [Actinoplanes sandaracinus]
MALIDLDLDAPPDRSGGRRPPPWRYRHLGLVVAAALLLALGGAAPGGGTFWRPLGLIPAEAGTEAPIQMAGGRAFTVASAGRARILTAWALEPAPHRLWTAEVPISASFDPVNGVFGVVRVERFGGLLVLTAGLSSSVLDAETGRVRWTTPMRITASSGGTALVTERIFRPGTLYDQDSGDPGMLYFSADGQPHTEPPLRTEVRGLDLASGAVLWTAAPGGSVTAEPVAGDRPAVLITASDRMTLRDARTGEVLREAGLPEMAGAGPGSSEVLDDVALIGYPEAGLEVGYDAHTLNRLWTRDLNAGADPVNCAGLLCSGSGEVAGGGEVRVLDRRTGKTAWTRPYDVALAVRAGWVLESRPASGAPVRLVDATTGEPRLELRGWTGQVDGFAAHVLLVWRGDRSGGRVFGAVLPGQPEVRVLGTAEGLGGECGGDERYVICRDVRGLRVWAYRI